MGDTHGAPLSVALYGGVLTSASTAFAILRSVLIKQHPNNAEITSHHLGPTQSRVQRKNLVSLPTYASSVPLAFVWIWASLAIFVVIPLLYFLPEARWERVIDQKID